MKHSRFDDERFRAVPVVGILRGFGREETEGAMSAAVAGGLTTVEITMDTPEATSRIRESVEKHGGRLNIGAGTVTSVGLLERALEAGAMFIVTPTLVGAVVERCVARGIPVFPGALSPTEIVRAWDMGARLVKVFPAEGLGLGTIVSLKEALPAVGLMPTGGVTVSTLAALAGAGASGFGVGSPLFRKEKMESRDWEWVTAQCRAFSDAWAAYQAMATVASGRGTSD